MCMLAIFGYVIFSTVCQNARILKLKVFFKEIRENLGISKYVRIKIGFIKKTLNIPLRRLKRSIFLGQGPVQGPQEEVQGPCARTTNPVNRNGCKGHLDMCKGQKKRCKVG